MFRRACALFNVPVGVRLRLSGVRVAGAVSSCSSQFARNSTMVTELHYIMDVLAG